MKSSSEKVFIILAFFAIYIIWGSTYLLNKIAVAEISPLFLSSIRFATAGILIFIIARVLKIPLKITRKQFLNSLLAGFLFLVYGNGVFVWGLKYVDSGFAALEASLQPLVIILILFFIYKEKMQLTSLIGVFLGITGIYLLVSQEALLLKEGSTLGAFIIFTCVISWSIGSIFVSKASLPDNYFVATAYQMVSAGLLLLLFSFVVGEQWTFPTQWTKGVQVSMLLLVVFGSIVAFTSFNYLLKKVSPEKVATSGYVNPIIALLLGWYILDEHLTLQSIIATVILLTGVYFINAKRAVKRKRN